MKRVIWHGVILSASLVAAGCHSDPVADLANQLKDHDASQREQAARSLGKLGPKAVGAVSALVAALDDPTPDVRRLAAYALGQIGPAASEAKAAMAKQLADPNQSVRFATAQAFVRVDPQDQVPVPILTEAFRSGDVGSLVILGLCRAKAADAAIPILLEALQSQHSLVRFKSAECLGDMDSDSTQLIAGLTQAVKDDQPHVSDAASRSLQKIRARQAGD